MSELLQPEITYYGLIVGKKPFLAIGIETEISVSLRGDRNLAKQIAEFTGNQAILHESSHPGKHIAIAFLGIKLPLN